MANSDLEPLVPEPVVDPNLPIRPASGNGAARQAILPELVPAFDFRAAFESIIERRATVRLAEEAAESKRVAYAHAKKHLEEEQATLSELEDAYTEGARLAVDALENRHATSARRLPRFAAMPAGNSSTSRRRKRWRWWAMRRCAHGCSNRRVSNRRRSAAVM